jgi:hypothetical protein
MFEPLQDADFDDLALDDLGAFLAAATDETLYWEAKGGDEIKPREVRRQVCGFANTEGGWLILGCDDQGSAASERWVIDGALFPDREPTQWVSNVLSALRPVPPHRVKAFAVGGGRAAVLVRVERTPTPPCMTEKGIIYERAAASTLEVCTPERLSALFSAGRKARSRATRDARVLSGSSVGTTMQLAAGWEPAQPSSPWLFGLGVAPTGLGALIGDRIFEADFRQAIVELVERRIPNDMGRSSGWLAQEGFAVAADRHDRGWRLDFVRGRGLAIHHYTRYDDGHFDHLRPEHMTLRFASELAAEALSLASASGETALSVSATGDLSATQGQERHRGVIRIERWSREPQVSDEILTSIGKEARRASGYAPWAG